MRIYKSTGIIHKAEVQQVGELLEKKFPKGNPKPEKIVELARDRNSILHKYFDWDNDSAAEKYRREQARHIIKCLYVVIEDDEEVRAYYNVIVTEGESDREFQSLDNIEGDEFLYDQVINSARREIIFWKRRYNVYESHFRGIFAAINKMEETHEKEKGSRTKRARGRATGNKNSKARSRTRDNHANR